MSDSKIKTGVLLVNLGTPDSPSQSDVKKYLREFLWDKRVIDLPPMLRFLLLYLIILPFRTRKSAAAYSHIWTKQGSPLLVHSKDFVQGLAQKLGEEYVVSLGMRYQSPSLKKACDFLVHEKQVNKVILIPLFPQYSSAATGSVIEEVLKYFSTKETIPSLTTVSYFYDRPEFINILSLQIQKYIDKLNPEYVLFSYHGLPESHIERSCGKWKNQDDNCCQSICSSNSFCYKAQCIQTTAAVVKQIPNLALKSSTCFQSRLGRQKWIGPDLESKMAELAKQGIKNLAVVCPSFIADCLETNEEIAIRGAETWKELGGEQLNLIPALNAEPDWIDSAANWIRSLNT